MAKKPPKSDNAAYRRLRQDLKSGQLAACYLLHGEESYLREHYFAQMKKALLEGPGAAFNHHKFTRENLDWDQLAAAVEAMPMLAARTLVEVDDIDLYKEPAEAREKLTAILEDLPDYCCLVFRYDTIPFAPDRRLKKLHAAVEAHVQVVEFPRQDRDAIRPWLRRHALAAGKDMDDAACDRLSFLTDDSLAAMASELQKLAAYAAGPQITVADIDRVVEPTLNAAGYEISDAVAGGDYDRALGKLRDLLAMQTEPVSLLGAVAAQLRRMYYAKILAAHGRGGDALQKLCAVAPYPARRTMEAARRVSESFCARAVLLCLEADRQLKSSYDDPPRILELLLLRLAREARA